MRAISETPLASHALLRPSPVSRAEALESCWRYLGTRSRLFRLGSLLPARGRDDLAAILAWRALLEEALEQPEATHRRLALEGLREELGRVLSESPGKPARTPIGIALSGTRRLYEMPDGFLRGPLEELVATDERVSFETRAALHAHARRLGSPTGCAALSVLGASSERNEVLADALSSGILLARWLAHFREHWRRGRLYLPVEELVRRGVDLTSLDADRPSEALRAVVADQIVWIRTLLTKGWPLCFELGPAHGRWLAFVLRWHAASLSAIEARRYDVTRGMPPAGSFRFLACACASAWTTRAPDLVR